MSALASFWSRSRWWFEQKATMKNVLVLGGTGFVGSHVCEKLARAGWTITVPTRRRLNAQRVMHLPGLTVLEADVNDAVELGKLVRGQDAVINLVGILHGSQQAFTRAHFHLPRMVAHACRNSGVRSLVHVSALGADGKNPNAAPSMYLRSKSQGEAVLTEGRGNVDLTILRPSVVFGTEDSFLNLFARLQQTLPVMPLAGAHARFQPVWVEDLAAAVVKSLQAHVSGGEQPVRVVEVCGPQVFNLRELVQMAAKWAGVNDGMGRLVINLPGWAGYLQALFMEMLPGKTLLSRDNLASMKVDNVATPGVAGLESLGIKATALQPIASQYLQRQQSDQGLLGVRNRYRS